MQISLNLASRPFADLGPAIKRLRIAMAVLAVLAIGLALGLRAFHQQAEEARARENTLDSAIARITLERQGYQNRMRQPENADLLAHVAILNKLFDEKAFSWTLAMEDLETVLPSGVQAATLEPTRAKNGVITLHMRVVGPRDKAVDLVRNLERSKRFLLPRIVGESAESTGGPGERLEPVSASNRVNFDLLADYNPATPTERKSAPKTEKPTSAQDAETIVPASHKVPLTLGTQAGRTPYTGQSRPPLPKLNPKSNPGGRP